MICVVLVQRFGFLYLVVTLFLCMGTLNDKVDSIKHINQNHGRQYAIELKSYVLKLGNPINNKKKLKFLLE